MNDVARSERHHKVRDDVSRWKCGAETMGKPRQAVKPETGVISMIQLLSDKGTGRVS